MKKWLLIVGGCILGMRLAYAHPPSDIVISYDADEKTVKAVIEHTVRNFKNHFIDKVHTELNGTEIIAHTIQWQDDNERVTVIYRVPDAVEGDVISIEGYCNKFGKLEKKITIEPAKKPKKKESGSPQKR